jgi:hypothetical protein
MQEFIRLVDRNDANVNTGIQSAASALQRLRAAGLIEE